MEWFQFGGWSISCAGLSNSHTGVSAFGQVVILNWGLESILFTEFHLGLLKDSNKTTDLALFSGEARVWDSFLVEFTPGLIQCVARVAVFVAWSSVSTKISSGILVSPHPFSSCWIQSSRSNSQTVPPWHLPTISRLSEVVSWSAGRLSYLHLNVWEKQHSFFPYFT